MDIRDILKSFDQLTEGESTVHKAGPGGYGNKHGSEDVTDQYGKPIGRMSLGKLGAQNEPKRGKGRPSNPDKAQSYDSSALSKAMGMGKAPKATGKPSVKHSLKEYFNQLDDALSEAGLAVQPMPTTPQQKQQQAVASKPSFMIKDPANPSTPAITTSDPAVVNAAKNGTMTMQKPGATPTAGAAPATGSGSQLGAMAEGGDVGKHNNATTGFDALVRKLTPKYGKESATKIAGAQFQKMKEGEMDEAAKWRSPEHKGKLYTQEPGDHDDYDNDMMDVDWNDYGPKMRPKDDPGQKRRMGGVSDEYYNTDPLLKWHRRSADNNINTQGKRAGLPSRDQITSLKQSIKNVHGQHRKSNLPEADAPQYFAQSSPLSTANRDVLESKKGVNPFAKKEETDKKKCPPMSHVKKMCQDGKSLAEICKMHPGCDRAELKQMVADCKKKLSEGSKPDFLDLDKDGNKKEPMKKAASDKKKVKIDEGIMDTLKGMLVPKLMKLLGPDAEKIASAVKQATGGDLTPSKENAMKVVQALGLDKAAAQGQSPQMAEGIAGNWQGKLIQSLYTLGLLGSAGAAASMWGTVGGNSMAVIGFLLLMFANAIFGEAPGQVGAMGNFGNKGTSAQRGLDDRGMPTRNMKVDESTKKKKVKEGMEHHLQAARLEGKSHALRKMPYNCTHDDMEEARHYHDGFKEGLDECYGQMPIMGRTAVDEMGTGSEVDTMASYGATGLGEMDKTSYMKQQAAKTPGDTFKAFGQTMSDSDVLDEFAFEAFDNQLSALLESEEKVSEGMTVSISKGQQGSPDSVSVSAQDGEADQLLSIIKSAGLGLFGGEEKGFNAPDGGAGAHGGINVVDDHDGMMALMKRLSGGEMSADDEQAGEEEHSHEGEEETCNECGGMMEAGHSCGSKEVVDEVESEDQMAYKVAEDNPPDSGADNTNADVAGNAAANSALATADAGQDEEEGQVYSSPTNEAEDETGQLDEISQELAVKTLGLRRAHGMDGWGDDDAHRKADATEKRVEKKFGKDAVAAADKITDKEVYGDHKMKEETVAESFANLYKKLAFLSEESTEKEDEKAEKAGKKVAKDIEYDEGHEGKDDDKAEKAGEKVKKDIEYDDKKDKKVDESYANSADNTFEADIEYMTKIISGGLNGQKSTGQTTVPVISGQGKRTGIDGKKDIKESMLNESVNDWKKLAGISK